MLPLFDVNPARRTPVVVLAFIVANVLLLALDIGQRPPGELSTFSLTWSLVPARLWSAHDTQAWITPLTAMFLHADWVHLAGNCWFLWLFGNNVEDRYGHVRFVLFYVVSGLGAVAAQVAVAPFSLLPMIGASGAISGVLGAYMRWFPRAPIFTLVPFPIPIVPIPAFVFAVIWFAFQFWQGAGSLFATETTGGVAWWAHVGGFLTGYAVAGSTPPARQSRRRRA
jgi:membrane associated rhomboid family serine protease